MNEQDFLDWVRARWEAREAAGGRHLDEIYVGGCLMGEAGEAFDVVKKPYRASRDLTPGEERALLLELGDAHHYLVRFADMRGFTMDQVRSANVIKLTDRDAEEAAGRREKT